MSNSSVKTFAQTGSKVFFVAAERIERTVRLQGAWLSIVDVSLPAGVSGTAQTIDSDAASQLAAPAEASGSPVAAQRMGAAANSGSTRIRAA
jgi:hypothetical protein